MDGMGGPRDEIAGMKRTLSDPDLPEKTRRRQGPTFEEMTPPEREASWAPLLKRLDPPEADNMRETLHKLAFEKPLSDELDRYLYSTLFRLEAYDVFLDVFAANMSAKRVQWDEQHRHEIDPPPFKTAFTLHVPFDNGPDFKTLAEVFKGLQVQLVEVVQEKLDSNDINNGALTPLMPEAVSLCIAALLKAGTSELTMDGTPTSPELIVAVFPGSNLESLALEFRKDRKLFVARRALASSDLASFRTLLAGLERCAKLTHLTIDNGYLLALNLHETFKKFDPATTVLESIMLTVRGKGAWSDEELEREPVEYRTRTNRLAEIMAVVCHFPKLSVFETDAVVEDASQLERQFLKPLQNGAAGQSLTRLAIHSLEDTRVTRDSLRTMSMGALFALSCPQLTHLALTSTGQGDEAREDLVDLQKSGGDIHLIEEAKTLEIAIKDPGSKLEVWDMSGMPLPSQLLRVVARALPWNTSIRAIHLCRNLLDLRAIIEIEGALKGRTPQGDVQPRNLTVEKIDLPERCDQYFVVGDNGVMYFLEADGTDQTVFKLPNHDEEGDDGDDGDGDVERSAAYNRMASDAFLPWKAQADGFFPGLREQLKENQRERNMRIAFPEIQHHLRHFLHAASTINHENNTSTFDIVSALMAEHLNRTGGIASVGRLPQVSKAVDTWQQHNPAQLPHKASTAFRRLAEQDMAASAAQERKGAADGFKADDDADGWL